MKRSLRVLSWAVILFASTGCDAARQFVDVVPPVVTVVFPPTDGTPIVGDEVTFLLSVVDLSEIVSVRYSTPAGARGACTGSQVNGFTCASVPVSFGLVEVTFEAEDAVGWVGTAKRTVLKVTPDARE